MTPPLHSMTPQELAHHGIPVEVALRARIDKTEAEMPISRQRGLAIEMWRQGNLAAYQDALAIVEAAAEQLRARIEATEVYRDARWRMGDTTYPVTRALDAYRDALAIIEAKS